MFHEAVQGLTPKEGDSNLILIDRSVESKNQKRIDSKAMLDIL